MKLLIITQKVDRNDDVLGFFHTWIEYLGRKFDSIKVICLYKGEYEFKENIEVLSLGKEENISKIGYLIRFYQYIWAQRNSYDAVFVHMNPQYILLGGPLWRMLGKRIVLWYAHGAVTGTLSWAEKLSDRIVTSTREGFRLNSNKVEVVGQGIDIDLFKPINLPKEAKRIVTVGRISPSKNYQTLIRAIETVKVWTDIYGSPAMDGQEKYLLGLKQLIRDMKLEKLVSFKGAARHVDLPKILNDYHLFVNTSLTGSLDKAILEAMACGLPVVTCNEAALPMLGKNADTLGFKAEDPAALAEAINRILNMPPEEYQELSKEMREIVVQNHSLESLSEKIYSILNV